MRTARATHFLDSLRSPPTLLFVLALSAVLSLLFAIQLWSWDIWWHLATGEWIVENQAIPTTDPFSFTARGEPWINVNWLGEVIFYAAWHMGGAAGVVAVKVITGFGILFFLGLTFRLLDIERPLLAASLISFAVLLQPRFSVARPFSIGAMLCAAAICLSLFCHLKKSRYIFLLVPLSVLWMNIHSSAVLAVPMTALLAALSLFDRRGGRTFNPNALIAFFLVLSLFLFTSRGEDLLTQVFAYDPASLIVHYTGEWKMRRIGDRQVWIPWGLFAAALLFGILTLKKYPLPTGLLLLGILLGTRYARHLFIGVLLSAPMIALMFRDVMTLLEKQGLLLVRRTVPVVMPLLVGCHMAVDKAQALNTRFGFDVAPDTYPDDTLAFLKALPYGRTIHNYHLGGYLLFHRIPGGVYMDGRSVQVFKEEHFKKLIDPIFKHPDGLEHIADRYDIVYGIADLHNVFREFLMRSNRWIPTFFGDSSVLFVREKAAEKLARNKLPLFPLVRYSKEKAIMNDMYDAILETQKSEAAFVHQFLTAAKRNPDSAVLARILTYLLSEQSALAYKIIKQLPDPPPRLDSFPERR
jgi:hypothetical protein